MTWSYPGSGPMMLVGDHPKRCAFLPKPSGHFCPPNPFHSPCSAQRCLTQRSPLENAGMMQDREPAKGEARTTAGRYSAIRTVGKGAVSLSLLLIETSISPWPQITACVRGVEWSLQIKTYSGGPALVLTSPLLPVVSKGTGGLAWSCGVRFVNFRKERVLTSLPAGTHGSLHPKKYWECGLRTERKELPSPCPTPPPQPPTPFSGAEFRLALPFSQLCFWA